MSEATIAAGIATAIKAMSEFANADVVHNDFGIYDKQDSAPFVLIGSCDNFERRQDVQTAETTWHIPVRLIELFIDWPTTLDNLRTRRQAIIDKINSGDSRSAGKLQVTIDVIANSGPITSVYGMYIEDQRESIPIYLEQDLILTCTEY